MNYTSKTQRAIRLIEIWNDAETRQEAFLTVQQEFGENITYPQMMNKITYARRQGVPVQDLEWDITDWSRVKIHFGDDDNNETFEIEG
jgi:hypothetical protein|tara:strand:- start:274 stop:537 length:264 start_codon:yes stop_codon:yes gene_type:complete